MISKRKRTRSDEYVCSGRSLGTGEVTFKLPHHATMADRRFNGILIDGKPLVIQQSGAYPSGQNPGPTKLSSGITVTVPVLLFLNVL